MTRIIVILGAVGLLAGVIWWENHERIKWKGEYNRIEAQELANAIQHKKELSAATDVYNAEVAAIRASATAGLGVGTVRLCKQPASVPAGATPTNDTSAPTGLVSELHEGDSTVRADSGPDIGKLLDAFAALSAEVNAGLRANQAVR